MKQETNLLVVTFKRRIAAWLVHAFTAMGAYVGMLALFAISQGKIITAFWFMAGATLIDAVDGLFARLIKVKQVLPEIDGALLDNIVDFFTYVIIPAFFILLVPIVPSAARFPCVIAIILSSAYQFTQCDAKTDDHFFKGFPSYWNIVVFYMFFCQFDPRTNLAIILLLAFLSFVPIKYVYPTRLDYLSNSKWLRWGMTLATCIWIGATMGMLWSYPQMNAPCILITIGYILLYVGVSLYRTWVPLRNQVS